MPSTPRNKSFYFVRPPWLVRRLYPGAIWRVKGSSKEIFLTFDDGPDPVSTLPLLDLLDQSEAKATFFVVGEKARQFPELVKEILARGHAVGSHGMRHLNGRQASIQNYLEDAAMAAKLLESEFGITWKGFRPPFGKMTFSQFRALKKVYEVVMWDLMPGDFESHLEIEKLQNRLALARAGSVVVLHDSPAAWTQNQQVLSAFMVRLQSQGMSFAKLPYHIEFD